MSETHEWDRPMMPTPDMPAPDFPPSDRCQRPTSTRAPDEAPAGFGHGPAARTWIVTAERDGTTSEKRVHDALDPSWQHGEPGLPRYPARCCREVRRGRGIGYH